MEEIKTKKCSKCGRELPMTSEFFHKGQSKDGFKTQCKECRGSIFGETRKCNRKRSGWTDEQIQYLKDNYSNTSMDILVSNIKKTKESINSMSVSLGLYKDELFWSEEELKILKNNYSKSYSVVDFLNNYLPNRTELAIRKKAHELNLKNDNIDDIRRDNLSGYMEIGNNNLNYIGSKSITLLCRSRLIHWVELVRDIYENKCCITGLKYDLVVHHLKSFRNIFNNVLNHFEKEYNFIIYETINEYYLNKQENLLDRFVKEILDNHNVEDGILIHSSLHKIFHSSKHYGSKNCSKEQFEVFKDNYYKGLYDNELDEEFKSYNSIKRLKKLGVAI